jgi:ABC-2 type transport system ATP-binding protein
MNGLGAKEAAAARANLESASSGARAPQAAHSLSKNSSSPVVEVRSLLVRYGGNPSPTLEEISFSVPRASVYALLGRNGAGKSSLVRCLLGQQKPTGGACSLFGEDVWKHRASLMAKVGVVPEDADAPPAMTARQLSAFCAKLYPTWDAPSVDARLARFGVPAGTPYGSLSKGQRALVALALALASSPELLVLDDPTLGLDAVARRAFFEELVGELADRGTTVLLTSHDLAGVESLATHVGFLKDGRLVLDEELETLKGRFRRLRYANEATEERTEFGQELSDFDAVRVKVRGWGVEAVVSNYGDEAFARFTSLEGVVDAESSSLSLEEIFVAVAGETAPRRNG